MPAVSPTSEEVDDIIAAANAARGDDGDDGDDEEVEAKSTSRRRSRRSNGKKTSSSDDDDLPGKEQTLDELDKVEFEPQLPKPAEKVKSLGSMYAKYGVGDDPRFTLQVWRTWPKMAPGGKKIDGFMDPWDQPLTEEQIQAEYGGGQYRITVMGPHPSKPNTKKHYDSFSISLAGDPKLDRLPRALQGRDEPAKSDSSDNDMPRMQMPMSSENPKLAEAALKMMQSTAQAEREERRRMEERMESRQSSANDALAPVIEAERRRADEVIRSERERRAEFETRMSAQFEEERRRNESERRRMEMMQAGQRSFGEELASLAPLLQRDDSSSKEMFKQILEKHRSEMDAMTTRHTQFVDSIRSGHLAEIQAIRQAHQRELEAEREASRARESRIDERLQSEREERRRDQDRFREQVEERDRNWRDRMEQAKETLESSWMSRHQSAISTYEQRIGWLQQEIDRYKSEVSDLKLKQEEKGDVATQLMKLHEMQEMVKSFAPKVEVSSASASSGGIGLSGSDDWKSTLVEGLAERAPAIAQMLLGGGGASQAAAPAIQEGQVLMADPMTGQPFPEPMIVVRDPQSGQLAMSPRSAIEAHARALQAGQRGGGLLDGQPQQRRRTRVMPDPAEVEQRAKKKTAVPNFSEGLPKPIPPWDAEGSAIPPGAPEPPPSPRPQPRMSTRSRASAEAPPEPLELSTEERQGLRIIAKLVHESVMEADEPEEFVAKIMNQYDPAIIRRIVGGYTTDQLVRGIRQVEPNGAGATPGGQSFVREAFVQLRRAVS